ADATGGPEPDAMSGAGAATRSLTAEVRTSEGKPIEKAVETKSTEIRTIEARQAEAKVSIASGDWRTDAPAQPAAAATASGTVPPAPSALPQTTLRQIADAVATGAAALPDSASVRAGAVAAAWSAAAQAEGPVRLLTLQLRPAELGQVQVRMRLQDGRLEMSLRAEREETAELLRRDGGLLTALVREAGYQPDLVTVQSGRVPGEAAPQPGQGGAPAGQSFTAAGGQQQGGASPDQPARRTPDAPEEGGRRAMEQRDDAQTGDRSGLYL
ncbi:flagellar hook-length control protein FliK, partial [uncultured Methylobacterium sp.]|uniref:flagellar hook-length control protein FliK n=1 Tax=uncultured Methylobacterium sp. TaxID=157278 RepID=UPI0025931CB3